MIRVKKNAFGNYVENSSGKDIVLEEQNYEELVSERNNFLYKYNDLVDKYNNLNRKQNELIKDYNKLVQSYKKISEEKNDLNKEIAFKESLAINSKNIEIENSELQKSIKVLTQIHREKSNAQRGITPKKNHFGYIFINSKSTKFRLSRKSESEFNVKLYKFQTPYDLKVNYSILRDLIIKDLKTLFENLNMNNPIFFENIKMLDKSKIEEALNNEWVLDDKLKNDFFDNSDLNNIIHINKFNSTGDLIIHLLNGDERPFIFNLNLEQNGIKGFWEIDFLSRDILDINEFVLKK